MSREKVSLKKRILKTNHEWMWASSKPSDSEKRCEEREKA